MSVKLTRTNTDLKNQRKEMSLEAASRQPLNPKLVKQDSFDEKPVLKAKVPAKSDFVSSDVKLAFNTRSFQPVVKSTLDPTLAQNQLESRSRPRPRLNEIIV